MRVVELQLAMMIGSAVATAALAEPYTLPAHWVEDAEYFKPAAGDFAFDALSFSSATEGWIVGHPFLLHVIGNRLELTVVDDKQTWLSGISFPVSGEGWVSGRADRAGKSEGVLWRHKDNAWTAWGTSDLFTPNNHGWGIRDVFFPNQAEGWGIGTQYPGPDGRIGTLLFHFDDGHWQADPSMRAEGRLWSFAKMCSDQSGQNWAVGTKRQTTDSPQRALLAARAGGNWREVPVSDLVDGEEDTILNQASCVTNGLVVAGWTGKFHDSNSQRGVVLTYTESWRRVLLPDHLGHYVPGALAANSADDFWVAATCVGPTGRCSPLFLHFSGGEWQEVPPPVLPGGRVARYSFSGMQFPSPDSGWAIANDVGGYAMFGLIFHYQNGVWRLRNWSWHFWHDRWFGLLGH